MASAAAAAPRLPPMPRPSLSPGSDSRASQLRSAATTHPKPTLALRRRMRPGSGGRGSGEEGSGTGGSDCVELALWQPDASHRRARPASLNAGARSSPPDRPPRPRRRFLPAGAQARRVRKNGAREGTLTRSVPVRRRAALCQVKRSFRLGAQRVQEKVPPPAPRAGVPGAQPGGEKRKRLVFTRLRVKAAAEPSLLESQDSFRCSPLVSFWPFPGFMEPRLLGKYQNKAAFLTAHLSYDGCRNPPSKNH